MKKEMFTQDELGLIATSLNAKIRELEGAIEKAFSYEDLKGELTQQLSDVKQVQQKVFHIYKSK